jgi:hypothetical protein
MPRDPNQRAKSVVDKATAEPEEDRTIYVRVTREAHTGPPLPRRSTRPVTP